MKATWVMLVLAASFLAGCTGDAESGAGDDTPEGRGEAADGGAATDGEPATVGAESTSGPEVKTWQGSMTGAGVRDPDGVPVMAGSFSTQDSVFVKANATRLTVELEAMGGVATNVYLRVWNPGGAGTTAGSLLDGSSPALTFDDPGLGAWEAMGFCEGGCAEASYEITATVEYA